jgi:hypothetical protein
MSLYSQLRGLVVVPHQQSAKVIVGPSDEEVKSRFAHFAPVLSDGPVPVRGVRIGWKRTTAGPLGAIFANPLTNRRVLWALDLHSHKPRHLAVL